MNLAGENTFKSMVAINQLTEQAMEIQKLSSIISQISKQTKLISLNATIESSKANKDGNAFYIIANNINKLAKLNDNAALEIENLVEDIKKYSKKANDKIGYVVGLVDVEINYINKLNNIFNSFCSSNRQVYEDINDINKTAKEIANKSNEIKSTLSIIKNTNNSELIKLSDLTNNSQKQLSLMMEIDNPVKELKNISKNLKTLSNSDSKE